MRVLLDECMDWRFKRELPGHWCRTVEHMGWSGIRNGQLLRLAETEFDVFVTTDHSLRFQQHIKELDIGVIVLESVSNDIEDLKPLAPDVLRSLGRILPGQIIVLGR